MKKLFIILILLLSVSLFAQDFTLENKDMSLKLTNKNKQVYLSSIYDKSTKTEFIKDVKYETGIWDLSVKKANDFSGKEILLYPQNAENINIKETKDKILITWTNVKTSEMISGFNVRATIEMNEKGSYWSIDVSPNKDYGIWYVSYPKINDIQVQNGDAYMFPFRGQGYLIKEFTENGFKDPGSRKEAYKKELSYLSPLFLQFSFLTKDNVSLYMSSEDINFYAKNTVGNLANPYHLLQINRSYVENMGVDNIGFSQPYKYHITTIKGDWYNVCKYYRDFGIKNNAPAFKSGKIISRNDIPDWLKNNIYWMRWYNHIGRKGYEGVLSTTEYVGIKPALHSYSWSTQFEFDTRYPNFYPAKEEYKKDVDYLEKLGYNIMPYTNAHLVDMGLSQIAKDLGSDLLSVDCNGKYYPEPYFPEKGTDFNACCIKSPYYKAYYDEMIKCIKECPFNALYIDQIGASYQTLCFNTNHNHNVGGGDYYVKTYNELIDELRKDLSEIKGEPIPLSTEDSAEAFNFDFWIRCNDSMAENMETPMIETIFSQYRMYFGDHLYDKWESKSPDFSEYEPYDGNITAIHKVGVSLVNGIQVGWCAGAVDELNKHKEFGKVYKDIIYARQAGLNYFNHGELMRKVEFVNEIPTANITWNHFSGYSQTDSPIVKTGSFNYNNKTMVCFINVSNKSVPVEWKSNYNDLGLTNKKSYTFNEFYPIQQKKITSKDLKGKFTLKPYEIKLIVID